MKPVCAQDECVDFTIDSGAAVPVVTPCVGSAPNEQANNSIHGKVARHLGRPRRSFIFCGPEQSYQEGVPIGVE